MSDQTERQRLEQQVQNRVGPIINIAEVSDEVLASLAGPNPDLSVLDRPASMCLPMPDERPLHEQLLGFRLW